MILFRHDDTAQIVIHTANMIIRDWTNMCQAIWRSPVLPLQSQKLEDRERSNTYHIGSGERFKVDLMHYFGGYRDRLRALVTQLELYDFSSIRAALVSSTPGKGRPSAPSKQHSAFGWPGLKQVLASIPPRDRGTTPPTMHVQISSIATLSVDWLKDFSNVCSTSAETKSISKAFFNAPATKGPLSSKEPVMKVIFPVADEIRRSLDGYGSGSSIHCKLAKPVQAKTFAHMKPMLCQWAGDSESDQETSGAMRQRLVREAGRRRAAPHIKTFICFSDSSCTLINWALLTSANLSKQAWGERENKNGDVSISSYEIGVLFWPELLADEKTQAVMVPTFKTDMPEAVECQLDTGIEKPNRAVIGFRMPYDLPLVPYKSGDMPWYAEGPDITPDWMGSSWAGYQ